MIIKTINKDFALITSVLCFLLATTQVQAKVKCELDNNALRAMPPIRVTLTQADGRQYSMAAKLADNDVTRAAGFQRVCESTIEAMPILFVFQREVIPSFHMNNVVAPIDIAFIDKHGNIESIHAMKPYSLLLAKKPLYSPKEPVLSALEVHKNFYQQHQIAVGSQISWVVVSDSE
jgi:uncharacterized membrane protein (UPF0127 family)